MRINALYNKVMKPLLLLSSVLLVGCSTPSTQPEAGVPARYATPDERMKLGEEARRNFEREREAHQSGTPRRNSEPVERLVDISEGPDDEVPVSTRRRYSAAEMQYALQIGKLPSELTTAERVLARMD